MEEWSGKLIGKYEILQKLGEGGMAAVYLARERDLGRQVAVKVIRSEQFPPAVWGRAVKRFEREAMALARLTHPNIVAVIDYGKYEGSPYLVMPYLGGGTFRDKMGKVMKVEEAARLLLPVARALAYAHGEGVVHRDVKPSNILLNKSGEPMLADFGLARLLEDAEATQLTSAGVGIGTPEYMAPEQWRGEVTPQVDIYALGVILYELAAGRKPYTGKTPGEVLLKQMSEPLIGVRQIAPEVREEEARAVEKALQREPERRYRSMEEFAAVLERLGRAGGGAALEETQTKTDVYIPPPAGRMAAEAERKKTDKPPERKSGRGWLRALGLLAVLGLLIWWRSAGADIRRQTAVPLAKEAPPAESARTREADGMKMVFVPAGAFEMGNQDGYENERPVHEIYLDKYWIDRTEVTNEMYARCAAAGVCRHPQRTGSSTRSAYYNAADYAGYPVIYVSWEDAKDYCTWAGARLPSEAEWEKAARGTDGRKYPWGEAAPSCRLLNYGDCKGDTVAAGSYPEGASPYGALDMAGNVSEWVQDWYDGGYYEKSPRRNPPGPSSGSEKITRGGSWVSLAFGVRAAIRLTLAPSSFYYNIGFRCALSP